MIQPRHTSAGTSGSDMLRRWALGGHGLDTPPHLKPDAGKFDVIKSEFPGAWSGIEQFLKVIFTALIRDRSISMSITPSSKAGVSCDIELHPGSTRKGVWILINVFSGNHEQVQEIPAASKVRVEVYSQHWVGITRVSSAKYATFSLEVKAPGIKPPKLGSNIPCNVPSATSSSSMKRRASRSQSRNSTTFLLTASLTAMP